MKINSTEIRNKTKTPEKKLINKNNNSNGIGYSQTNSNSLNFNFEELFNDKASQSMNSFFKKNNSYELNKSNPLNQKSKRYYVQKKLGQTVRKLAD